MSSDNISEQKEKCTILLMTASIDLVDFVHIMGAEWNFVLRWLSEADLVIYATSVRYF